MAPPPPPGAATPLARAGGGERGEGKGNLGDASGLDDGARQQRKITGIGGQDAIEPGRNAAKCVAPVLAGHGKGKQKRRTRQIESHGIIGN